MYRISLCLLLTLICSKAATAQALHTYSFSEQYNLNSGAVYYLLEDSERNMWIGAEQGLFRFDGTSFTKFRNERFSVEYSSVQEDREGRIWCQNFMGQIFYVEEDSLKLFNDDSEFVKSSLHFSVAMFPEIYVCDELGIRRLDFHTGKSDTILKKPAFFVVPDQDGFTYMHALKSTLLRYSYHSGEETALAILSDNVPVLTPPSPVWVGDRLFMIGNMASGKKPKGFIAIAGDDKTCRKIPYKFSARINTSASYFDKDALHFWVGTDKRVLIFDDQFHKKFEFLENRNISSIRRDSEGNYWVGTLNDGIYIVSTLDINLLQLDLPDESYISSIQYGPNEILYLIEEYGKIYKLDGDNRLTLLGDMRQNLKYTSFDPYRNELHFGTIPTSFRLTDNSLQPCVYGYNHKSITYLSPELAVISGSFYSTVVKNTSGLKPQKYYGEEMEPPIPGYPFHRFHLRNKRAITNAADPHGKQNAFYIAYIDGLYRYEMGEEAEVKYQQKPVLASTLISDKEEGVWCATVNNHLLYIVSDEVKKDFKVAENVGQISQWDNFLFLATEKGVIKVNKSSGEQHLINHLDGLPSDRVLAMGIRRDSIFVSTTKGIAKFACSYHFKKPYSPNCRNHRNSNLGTEYPVAGSL